MQIPLDHFEQIIDERILKRGFSYYKKGNVLQLDEVSPNTYEAVVEGTDDYTVQLSINNDMVTEYVCNCPYDQGPVCKHVAAVLFKLQEEQLQLDQVQTKSKPKTKNSSGKKRKSTAEQIEEVLAKATKDELVQLIRDEAANNATFRNRLMMALEHYNDNISKDFYAKQIQSILRSAVGRYGFVDWEGSIALGLAVGQLLDSAQVAVNKKNYQNALYVCFAVMEVLIPALSEVDDSNGETSGCIYAANELLYDIAYNTDSEEIHQQIFDFCSSHYEQNSFKGWDWHTDMLRLASELANCDKEYDRLMPLVDKKQESEYDEEQRQLIKYRMLQKVEGKAAAAAFLQQNLTNPKLRRIALQDAMDRSNYNTAIGIAKDGVKQDMKQYPGLAKEWYDWLLKIAQAQHDTTHIIEYARFLLVDNFRHEQDYYQILKQYVQPEQWDGFVDSLIKDIKAKNRGYYSSQEAQILIKEKRWEQLWDLVCEMPSLQSIEQYESYFSKRQPDDLAELYAKRVLEYMEHNMGRDHYQNACRYIRRIIKLGARQKANEVIGTLRELYPKRRALLEELDNV